MFLDPKDKTKQNKTTTKQNKKPKEAFKSGECGKEEHWTVESKISWEWTHTHLIMWPW